MSITLSITGVMPAGQAQGKTWRGPVELNVLCGIADYSTQSGQPVTEHLGVEITPSSQNGGEAR